MHGATDGWVVQAYPFAWRLFAQSDVIVRSLKLPSFLGLIASPAERTRPHTAVGNDLTAWGMRTGVEKTTLGRDVSSEWGASYSGGDRSSMAGHEGRSG